MCAWRRAHTDEREKCSQDRMSVERKLSELFRLLTLDSQYRDLNNVVNALDHVLNKVAFHSSLLSQLVVVVLQIYYIKLLYH